MPDVNTPYQDRSGRPMLLPSVAGFVDMLGFSSMSVSAANVTESQHLLERIAGAIEQARQMVREYIATVDAAAAPAGWTVKYFSDNLVLGCPAEADGASLGRTAAFVIRCVQRYQLQMALKGFFIRGALTHGLICLTDEIIYGPTLIESYLLESKTAIVPRLLVTAALQEAVTARHRMADDNSSGNEGLICRDIDGWWFVNYLEATKSKVGVDWSAVARHKQSILASLASTTRHDVLPKYGWACRYHNVFCHWNHSDPAYRDEYRIDRVDEQSTILRIP